MNGLKLPTFAIVIEPLGGAYVHILRLDSAEMCANSVSTDISHYKSALLEAISEELDIPDRTIEVRPMEWHPDQI